MIAREPLASAILDAALGYARLGWPVLPLHGVNERGQCTCSNVRCDKAGKHPRTEHGLKDATCDEEIIRRWFTRWPDANVGTRTDFCVVLDVDPRHGGDKSLTAVEQKYGAIPVTHESKTGGDGRHLFFARQNGEAIRNSAGKLGPGLDIRAEGGYVVLPPSSHSSGNRYYWVRQTDLAPLPAWIAARLAGPDPTPHSNGDTVEKIAEGKRNNYLAKLAGAMRHKGAVEQAIEAALLEENRRRCDPPLPEQEVKRITASITRYQPEPSQSQPTQSVQRDSDWSDPAPLGDELPPVPAFDLELLPTSFRPLVEDVSERMQTPLDYAAVTAVVALAGCVNRRAIIQPKMFDTSWTVVPNLWGIIVGPPGIMKSPVQQAVIRPLTLIEGQWQDEYQREVREFEKQKRSAKPSEDEPEEPIQRRLVLMDSTFEKLHSILRDNPAGVIIVRDELSGWMSQLERQGREGERQFYLTAWDGHASFTIDRIERGSIYVPAVCVSLLGGIQPARLRGYLSEVMAGGPADDGLVQRFQLVVWPDPPKDWQLIDRPPNSSALKAAERVYSTLAELSPENPVRIRFESDPQSLFFQWLEELERKVRSESGLGPVMVSHLAKFRSLMPSLAGLFELADRVAAREGLSDEIHINLRHAQQAAAICEYLEAHAHRVYSCIVSPELRSVRELAGHIRRGALQPTFTTRIVYLKGWAGLDDPEKAQAALRLLEDAGWVRRARPPASESGGRPSESWAINPKVKRHAK